MSKIVNSDADKEKKQASSSDNNKNISFFEKFLGLLTDNSPEGKKKRLLKDIRKILQKHKYKFFNTKTEEILPPFASFFYQIYKVTAVPSKFMLSTDSGGINALKYRFIDYFLADSQRDFIGKLQPGEIEKRVTEKPAEAEVVKADITTLMQSMTQEQYSDISRTFKQFLIFERLLKFDYYFVLRKFDSRFAEMDFKYKSSFQSISAEYITDDILDTLALFPLLIRYPAWDDIFNILKDFKGADFISKEDWRKALRIMTNVHNSGVLLHIAKLILKEPFYSVKLAEPTENICEEYFGKLKTSAESVVQNIVMQKEQSGRNVLLEKIFGTTQISRMKNYTEANSGIFRSKMVGGYMYVDLMNYIKAFMLDYVKKDIIKLVNHLVVKAEWKTNKSSHDLSNSVDDLLKVSDSVLAFDDSLAFDVDVGAKINSFMKRIGANPKYKTEIKKMLIEVDTKALAIAKETYRSLVVVAQALAGLLPDLEDVSKQSIIINPTDVIKTWNSDIIEDLKKECNLIYNFVTLLKSILIK